MVKMVASLFKASSLSAGIGANGLAGDRFWRMVVRSRAAAMVRSAEEGVGMTTLVGNQASVSVIQSAGNTATGGRRKGDIFFS